jgi:hypothetical protein
MDEPLLAMVKAERVLVAAIEAEKAREWSDSYSVPDHEHAKVCKERDDLRVVTAYHVPHSETVEDHMVVVLEDGSSYTWGNEGWQLHTTALDELARGGGGNG